MKLYAYDHCPFCVRARMIFGLKNLPFELVILANDDETTPIGLVGKKVVPILIKEDGTAMPESLDIVRYVDENFGERILSEQIRPEIEEWVKKLGHYYNHLLIPRFVKMDLAEFKTQSAVDYFTKKKTESIGDFQQNLDETANYLVRLHQDLENLVPLIQSVATLNDGLSLEDIIVFPMLRNLTCVRDIQFPPEVRAYLEKMSEQSGVDLYFDKAI
ncbi:glutaredoxin 2 [Rodentibacter pneumotropicus]|uniref:glutaredoxin 2 n=1 Tax=Rodentibacter pneumotropicus TaxID=758 RepID=UPI00035DB61E|nr:glutaredoxin 2 [Rodentibacter pneumotropicus]MDC2824681.1 glutaredoxin 2 [Rodentibacter pneumotropicus]NBH74681.1 glutaredoxin 2 [Rodentibacter pneumotropicus]OOF65033.1 glutaredoxin, GrxB family [Rodentibacter pneumotropicus]THA00061.1 glutaredoxin 2 [Rodentibacter pneumotropicus]THA06528.1 glutaredoxin 2 [Rodentibacter pneumotropicus]